MRSVSAAGELYAWLGPAIGAAAFEVGDEVRAAFVADDAARGGGLHREPARPLAVRPMLRSRASA